MHERHSGIRFDVDAANYGNETRFINDYHGVAPQPNVAFVLYYAPGTGELAVGVVTQVQGCKTKFEVDALGVITISRGCFECSCSKKKTCTHRFDHITLVS